MSLRGNALNTCSTTMHVFPHGLCMLNSAHDTLAATVFPATPALELPRTRHVLTFIAMVAETSATFNGARSPLKMQTSSVSMADLTTRRSSLETCCTQATLQHDIRVASRTPETRSGLASSAHVQLCTSVPCVTISAMSVTEAKFARSVVPRHMLCSATIAKNTNSTVLCPTGIAHGLRSRKFQWFTCGT